MIYIGVDFDNTIICYDELFWRCGIEEGLIPKEVKKSKNAVREYLWSLQGGNDKWIYLQVVVYGKRIKEAVFKKGAFEFLKECKDRGVKTSIISHKTEWDNMNWGINLRTKAIDWMRENGFFRELGFSEEDVFFGKTRDEKIEMIKKKGCTHFIDDLKEVFLEPEFPDDVEKIYYNPDGSEASNLKKIKIFHSWDEIYKYFFG